MRNPTYQNDILNQTIAAAMTCMPGQMINSDTKLGPDFSDINMPAGVSVGSYVSDDEIGPDSPVGELAQMLYEDRL